VLDHRRLQRAWGKTAAAGPLEVVDGDGYRLKSDARPVRLTARPGTSNLRSAQTADVDPPHGPRWMTRELHPEIIA